MAQRLDGSAEDSGIDRTGRRNADDATHQSGAAVDRSGDKFKLSAPERGLTSCADRLAPA
jgi:hypothetical protein